MTDGVVAKNVASIHRDRSIKSEQISQAIMGQPVRIEEDREGWMHVETWDTYHGWIQASWVTRSPSQPSRIARVTSLFTDALKFPDPGGEIITKLVITTAVELLDEIQELARIRLPDGQESWVRRNDIRVSYAGEKRLPLGPVGADLVRDAKRFLGIPYLWGGTTPFGLDCSGFVQLVYSLNGVPLLRDAAMQADDPRAAHVRREDILAGDLVFFALGEDKTRVNHVGLATGDGIFIHCTGGIGVTISRLDEDRYARDLHGTRRMV